MSDPPKKRYRRDEKSSESEEDVDNYEPYVPVKERMKQKLLKLGRLGQVANEVAAETKSSSDNDPDDEGMCLKFFNMFNVFIRLSQLKVCKEERNGYVTCYASYSLICIIYIRIEF